MDNGIDLFGASAFLVTPDTDHHNSVTTRWMTHLPGGTIEVTPSVTRHGASSVTQHVATSVTPHITTSVTSRGMSMSTPKLPKSVLYSPHATDTWSIADSLLQRSNRSRKNVFSNGDRLQFDTSNADGAPASRDVPGCQPASGDGSVQPKNVEIGRGTYSSWGTSGHRPVPIAGPTVANYDFFGGVNSRQDVYTLPSRTLSVNDRDLDQAPNKTLIAHDVNRQMDTGFLPTTVNKIGRAHV